MKDPLVDGAETPEGDEEAQPRQKRQRRLQRFGAYYCIKWTLQSLCALMVIAVILWATIQFMRIWNVLGISQEPPGLCADGARTQTFPAPTRFRPTPLRAPRSAYFVPGMAPNPPPPPLILVGR